MSGYYDGGDGGEDNSVEIENESSSNETEANDGYDNSVFTDDSISNNEVQDNNTEKDSQAENSANTKETDTPVENGSEKGTPEKISCRNESLEGSTHPETGVPFNSKTVEVDGKTYEVVAPEFESKYDAQLPENLTKASDREQFKECNNQLREAVENDEELRSKFDEEQLEQIKDGETPDGYVWHHDVEVGKMQLVDQETHQKTGHTGGKAIWGGGSENR